MASTPENPKPPSPWLKRVLIPFWILQLVVMLFLLLICGVVIASDFVPDYTLILAFAAFCTILDITEIILFARHNLQPLTYLILQCVKTGFWLIDFIITLVNGLSEENSGNTNIYLPLRIIVSGALDLAFIGSLIYGGVIFHRKRLSRRRGPRRYGPIENAPEDQYYTAPPTEYAGPSPDYVRPAALNASHNGGSPTVHGSQLHTAVPGLYERDAGPPGPFQRNGESLQEIGTASAEEMSGDNEIYELGMSRTVTQPKGAPFRAALMGDRPADTPQRAGGWGDWNGQKLGGGS